MADSKKVSATEWRMIGCILLCAAIALAVYLAKGSRDEPTRRTKS